MVKHRRHKRTMRRHQRGGDLAGNPPSAWGWGMGTLGNGWTQFMNSLTLQPGQNMSAAQSNNIVAVGNTNAQTARNPNMSGGKHRRRHSMKRCRKGGNVGAILAQAAVPGTLLVLNQSVKRRHRKR